MSVVVLSDQELVRYRALSKVLDDAHQSRERREWQSEINPDCPVDETTDLPFVFVAYRSSEQAVRAFLERLLVTTFVHGGQLRAALRQIEPEYAHKAREILCNLVIRGWVRPLEFRPDDYYSVTAGINYGPVSSDLSCWSFAPPEDTSGLLHWMSTGELKPIGDEMKTAKWWGAYWGRSFAGEERRRKSESVRLFNLASECDDKGWKEAEDLFLRAIELDPTNTDAMTDLGGLYALRGRSEPALDWLMRSMRNEPSSAAAYNLGWVYIELLEDRKKAIPYFEQSLSLNPEFEDAKEWLRILNPEVRRKKARAR